MPGFVSRLGRAGSVSQLHAIAALLLLAGVAARGPGGLLAALYASDDAPPKAPPSSGDNSAPAPQPQAPNPPQRAVATSHSERPVAAALWWLAHHQMPDGRWSLQKYKEQCKDESCTGPGKVESDAAATSMAVLCFLAAGQTHASHGPFKSNLISAIDWLIAHQTSDGDLSDKAKQQMYSHGLASTALCECYAMSNDKRVGDAAQKAIDFIETAQNKKSGGWGLRSGDEGDTITCCWQLQALRSAHLAKLNVKSETFDAAKQWLLAVAKTGPAAKVYGQFPDKPGGPISLTASAAGLLCLQLLHVPSDSPDITAGVKHLVENLPDAKSPDLRYWYFGTVAMHNMADKDWDTWNRRMRKMLVEGQIREKCAAGSWDPDTPAGDDWRKSGGRVTATSFSCLMLEVYYRYLPLFKPDRPAEKKPAQDEPGKEKSEAEK